MTLENLQSSQASSLRRRAVERVAEHIRIAVSHSGHDTRRMLQEMERYNIELELQIEELRQQKLALELNYDELYDSTPVGYVTLGRNGEIEIANLAAASMLGQPRAWLLRQRLVEFLAAESLPSFNEFFARVMGGYNKESCLVTLVKAGNTPRLAYIEATGVGPESGCRAMLVDITSAEQAMPALFKREAHLNRALSAADMGVWQWERNSGAVSWSQECVKIFGINSICPTIEAVAQLIHPEDAPRVGSLVSKMLAEWKPQTIECRIIRPNGEVIWLLAHGKVHLNRDGEPSRLIGVVHNITEHKRMEQSAR